MKISYLMLLLILPIKASAEWKEILKTDVYGYYMNTEGIDISGSKVSFWKLINNSNGSERGQIELDCSIRKFRILHFSSYSKQFAGGRLILVNNKPTEWSPIPPDSILGLEYDFLCAAAE